MSNVLSRIRSYAAYLFDRGSRLLYKSASCTFLYNKERMQMKTKQQQKKKPPTVPYHRKPDSMTVEEWQTKLRQQFAIEQTFTFKNVGDHPVFSDFMLHNPETHKTYKIAIRSDKPGYNFCSCPDFTVNTLGTCKHIEFILHRLKKNAKTKLLFKEECMQPYSAVFLKYGRERKIMLYIGTTNTEKIRSLASGYFDANLCLRPETFDHFETFVEHIVKVDPQFRCYKDAMDYILEIRDSHTRVKTIDKQFAQGIHSKGLDEVLKTHLYPYQKEGILFAAKAGRALIADDMGLGKTIQAMGVAELLAHNFGITNVLIICPTSLKYQWQYEIEKFSSRSVCVIEGNILKRKELYRGDSFFKIVSYNAVQHDTKYINDISPDLIILDEAQRIKNWRTKTAHSVKTLVSPYALVLTGTPLENRLEELHSIVEFIDRYKLGPLFKFLDTHQKTDDTGKIVGYKALHAIKETLSPILIRRTKAEVLQQLPPRIDNTYFVDATREQMDIHEEYYDTVCRLVNKWKRFKFLSEKERQILLISLNCMRMVSDSTYILDQKTNHGNKIAELMILLKEILEKKNEKIVIFSQWERMTRLVARELEKTNVGYEYLHGGIPSHKRASLLQNFRENPEAKIFLSTDAGGVGLNLQSASTVVNLDCPWNPAVLEQRIGRVHRLGQHNPVQVVNFISKGTIEENILHLLTFKKSLFDGVLDHGENEIFMKENKMQRFMKTVETITENRNAQGYVEHDEETETQPPVQESILQSSKQDTVTTVHDLFETGVSFLQKLHAAVSSASSDSRGLSSFLEKDATTQKIFIKIPVPQEAVLQKAAEALQTFLSVLKR